jgi:hypothetical protein
VFDGLLWAFECNRVVWYCLNEEVFWSFNKTRTISNSYM